MAKVTERWSSEAGMVRNLKVSE